jgi:type IV pilus assembly protein PilB
MTDQELLKELVKKQLLKQSLADRILKDAELLKRPAEEMIYSERLLDEEEVAKVKSELLDVPFKKVDPNLIPDDVLNIIPKEISQNYRLVPLEKSKDMLVVGMLRPDDLRAQEALKFIAKREKLSLGVYVIAPSVLGSVWRRYTPYKTEIEMAVKDLRVKSEGDERIVALEEGARTVEEAPIIKIVASTLKQAVEILASDVHIEPQRSRLRIRFRIDGKLQEAASLPLSLSQPIISRVKVLARLRLDENRIPQDGRFRTIVSGRDIDYRVSTFPTPTGEQAAIRVLDPRTGLKSFSELGLSDYNFKILDETVRAPYGMILLTGPTGSGKTTTLYAIMQKINSENVNIVSLEDPVEYFIDGVNQSQVKPDIGYDFASGLRQILRQDPDIILVGEIRDKETASLAVNAALTGHLMLSTLHTNNSVGVIPRLIDLGVPAFILPSALKLMVAQRLVGQLCPDCRKEEKAPLEVQKLMREELEKLPNQEQKFIQKFKDDQNNLKIYHRSGRENCNTCKGRGIVGRIAIFEIFKMTQELGEIINAGFTENKLWEEAKRQGMITLRQDGIIKALEGKVLIEEVLRETEES